MKQEHFVVASSCAVVLVFFTLVNEYVNKVENVCDSAHTEISGSYIFDSRTRIYYYIQYSQMHYLNNTY